MRSLANHWRKESDQVSAPARKISCPPEYFTHRLCYGQVPAQPAAHRPESRPVGEAQFVPEIGEQNLVDLSDNQCSVSIVIFPLYLLQNRCRLDIPSENVTKLKPIRRRKAAMKYFVQKLWPTRSELLPADLAQNIVDILFVLRVNLNKVGYIFFANNCFWIKE